MLGAMADAPVLHLQPADFLARLEALHSQRKWEDCDLEERVNLSLLQTVTWKQQLRALTCSTFHGTKQAPALLLGPSGGARMETAECLLWC